MYGDTDGTTAIELLRRIRAREMSPTEILESTLASIERRNPSLNAFVHIGYEDARRQAAAVERRLLSRGDDTRALDGVPTAIKDLYNFYPGWPSTFGGIPALAKFHGAAKSNYPDRMEADGAVVVGATNSSLMGFRGTCDNPLFGPTRNPFDLERNSGGSSGGSAAAVSDGIIPVAGATDGGGSIRIPAAWCGVFGFQPSFGRVPILMQPNVFGATAPFVYEGPVSRTVSDAALVMTAIAGRHPADPFSLPDAVDWNAATQRQIKGKVIGLTMDYGVFAVDPRIAAGVASAAKAFEEQGAAVVPIDVTLPASQTQLSDLWCRMISAGSAATINQFKAAGFDLMPELPTQLKHWVDQANSMTLAQLHADQVTRSRIFETLQRLLSQVDYIVAPTTGALAVPNACDGDTLGPNHINGQQVNPLIGWCLTYLTNFTGHPAASVPAGLIDGLPFGMHIIGRMHADADVIAASARFEEARPWMGTYDARVRRD